MIDPISIPFLLKTVEFLFGEENKILEERRDCRRINLLKIIV
jgi:hypothetical protein